MSNKIVVYLKTDTYEKVSVQLATRLHLSVQKKLSLQQNLILYYDQDGLCLQQCGKDAPVKPIQVDFTTAKIKHRLINDCFKKEYLAKAVGIKNSNYPDVLDVTAGLGRDAFILAALGCEVTLLERSPIVAALLEDGLKRGALHAEIATIIARMHLIQIDCMQYMRQCNEAQRTAVVYLDPMFPPRKKSALVKKEMRILHNLLQDEVKINETELLNMALKFAKKRVVVKRPYLASPLANCAADFVIKGKSCRFDIYVTDK
jgi:16S rRNA (guanine1516-N2)-methyltransferase